jgi:hypothetical protein
MSLKLKTSLLAAVLALTLTVAGSAADGSTPARWIVFSAARRICAAVSIVAKRQHEDDRHRNECGSGEGPPAVQPR